jgi:hypothetical protein
METNAGEPKKGVWLPCNPSETEVLLGVQATTSNLQHNLLNLEANEK